MLPQDATAPNDRRFLEPAVMGSSIVWLASDDAAGVHDERIVAAEFDRWLGNYKARQIHLIIDAPPTRTRCVASNHKGHWLYRCRSV